MYHTGLSALVYVYIILRKHPSFDLPSRYPNSETHDHRVLLISEITELLDPRAGNERAAD